MGQFAAVEVELPVQSEGICMFFFVENWECFQLVVPQPKQITPENG